MMIELYSVGNVIDSETLLVYPMLSLSQGYLKDVSRHVDEYSTMENGKDWFKSMGDSDRNIVMNLIKNRK